MGKQAKKREVSKKNTGKKGLPETSKSDSKHFDSSKSKNRKKSVDISNKLTHDKKNAKPSAASLEKKSTHRKNFSKELKKKHGTKSEEKKGIHKIDEMQNGKSTGGPACFLCFCCGGNEDEELNEMLLQEEIRRNEAKKKREDEEKKRKEEEEKREEEKREEEKRAEENRRKESMEKKRKEEEEKRRNEEEEEKRRREEERRLKEEAEEEKPKTVLKKIEAKPKPLQKKAQIVFTGSAAAPPPPAATECEGPPPKVKETSVSLGQGAYLIYQDDNGGQLEIRYSKEAIKVDGLLAYISAANIPNFYFNKNNGKDVLIKNVKTLMQSEYVKDRILYYEKWNDFLKLRKTLDGTLYLLPAFNHSPPALIDIIFLSAQQKKVIYAPVEKPVEFVGDYMFIIQRGLEIFRKEVNADNLVSYVNSFGVVAYN